MPSDFLSTFFGLAAVDLLRLRLIVEKPIVAPAAGADWLQKCPGGVTWEILSVEARLSTSAVVANRQVVLQQLDSDGKAIFEVTPNANIAAGAVQRISYSPVGAAANLAGVFNVPIPNPPLVLLPGWSIGTATGAIDVGDQWDRIFLLVREWDETAIMQEIDDINELFESYISPRFNS